MRQQNIEHMTITDKNGNEFYVIPACEYQPQPSKKDTFLSVVGAVAITLFFVTFLTRTARKLFT
jgi:hypothetical protein